MLQAVFVSPDLGPVLAAWDSADATPTPLGAGLINQTWLVTGGPHAHFVLQRLHRIFRPEVNEDIDVVTRHLEARGLVTPRIVPTRSGALWHAQGDDTWRALTWIDGVTFDRLDEPRRAHAAGALLARFHRALSDLRHHFRHARIGVHDTARHLGRLRQALDLHAGHARFGEIAPLARRILDAAAELAPLPETPERVVHGDPKANNVLFARGGERALCLIDLDTLSRMRLPLELGDALRSWCNPAGEDHARASFSLELFTAAVEGYATDACGFVTAAERSSLVVATETIYVELAARFCADALEESYFGWDPQRFASRSEHNQVRAESQLAAARSLAHQRAAAEAVLRRVFTD